MVIDAIKDLQSINFTPPTSTTNDDVTTTFEK